VFQAVIYDSYTARRDGVKATGNATRSSHRELPALRPTNFYLQPGVVSRDALIAGVERGLYVTSIMQTGGINPITGDCSMGANGLWIEKGVLTHAVNGVTVATTLPDLLKNISEVASDLRIVPFMGAIGAPTIRVENVTVGGMG
jgi:PmbA protein